MDELTTVQTVTRFDARDKEPECVSLTHGEAICFSDRSPVKNTANEDSLAIIPINNNHTVLVVADGMGGMPAGEQASLIIIECLIASIENNTGSIREAILNGIDEANKKTMEIKAGSGSTVSIVEIFDNKCRTYHAGDSSILLLSNDGIIKYQTLSHSPISYAFICGALNSKQAMLHPERNLIANYIGYENMYLTIGSVIELAPEDILFLSSDAVSDNLYDDEICKFIHNKSMPNGINALIKQCQHNMNIPSADRLCHPDDLTVIGFRLKT